MHWKDLYDNSSFLLDTEKSLGAFCFKKIGHREKIILFQKSLKATTICDEPYLYFILNGKYVSPKGILLSADKKS